MRRQSRARALVPTVALILLAGCGSGAGAAGGPSAEPQAGVGAQQGVQTRLEALDEAVTAWQQAGSVAEAQRAAEAASNLVTGPGVTGYGDLDSDGDVAGANESGLLPGEDGDPGLIAVPASACVEQDVLGGSWVDPTTRWAEVRSRIDQWSDANNTFPGLPSHPQRIVGWAALTLASDDVELAREYAGHARLHVDVTVDAFDSCGADAAGARVSQ